jgi:hypothetical protein
MRRTDGLAFALECYFMIMVSIVSVVVGICHLLCARNLKGPFVIAWMFVVVYGTVMMILGRLMLAC